MSDGEAADEDREYENLHCSFCSKSPEQVRKLVTGPTANICDECIEVCSDIISDDRVAAVADSREAQKAPAPREPMLTARCSLCRMPVAVEELLGIIGRGAVCLPCISAVQAIEAGDDEDEAGEE
jgi:hypothetical protein